MEQEESKIQTNDKDEVTLDLNNKGFPGKAAILREDKMTKQEKILEIVDTMLVTEIHKFLCYLAENNVQIRDDVLTNYEKEFYLKKNSIKKTDLDFLNCYKNNCNHNVSNFDDLIKRLETLCN